jgi:hypothetical protein
VAAVIDKAKYFKSINYEPHPEQIKFHNSKARFRIACCGRRFGKSTMAARDLEPYLFVPKTRYWIVGPTYDLGEKEFRVIWDDLMIGKGLAKDKRIKKAYNKKQGDMYIEFPWQTRLEVRSAEHPENLVGDALNGVIMSEAAKQKEQTWKKYIRPALTDYRGFATFPTTPEGFNWLHRMWQDGQNPDKPLYESWQFPSWANTAIYPDGFDDPEIQELKASTITEWFEQEIGAEFSAFVGKIYGEWRENKHVKKHEFNPMWPNYIAFDWGFTNPMAAIEFQVAPDDTIYVWREYYKAFTTLEVALQEMKCREQPKGYRLDMTFGDAADPEAAAYVSQHFKGCYALPEAKENWRQGIMCVKRFLKDRETGLYDEFDRPITRPGLYVDNSCKYTIKEFNNYRSKEAPNGNNVPEMGQKVEDHAMDALRYGLMHLYELGANHHLEEVYTPLQGYQDPDPGDLTRMSGMQGAATAELDHGMFVSTNLNF